jgi:hypothetical protein
MKPEEALHIQICTYIKLQYPNVIFTSESSGEYIGGKDGKGWARLNKMKQKRSGSKLPDIWIIEPINGYHGLFLEVKTSSPFKKDMTLKKSDHLQEQSNMIDNLFKKGYYACFVWSFEMAVKLIDDYMNGTITYIEPNHPLNYPYVTTVVN